MIEKLIGKKDDGIRIKIYDNGGLTITEFVGERDWSDVNATPDEAKILKDFLNENL